MNYVASYQLLMVLQLHYIFFLADIGSTEEYWKRQDAADVIALVKWLSMIVNVLYVDDV